MSVFYTLSVAKLITIQKHWRKTLIMNFNIYIDDKLGAEIGSYAEKKGMTRNSLIRKALQLFIRNQSHGWPDEILQFTGVPNFPAFESYRTELLNPKEDPLE
jgi:hypothetical protein